MYSLSKEEQWKILQREERITGRGRKKKEKTLIEQLRDMGGFGDDPDGEEEVSKDLKRRDTRRPLQYSFSDSELSSEDFVGEDAFRESRRRLFKSWIVQARRPSSWIEKKHIPLLFRFALHRPLMDEMTFQRLLQELDLKLKMSMGDVRQLHTQPIGRSRKLLYGIDVDKYRNTHPSNVYRDVLPKGVTEDTDRVTEEVRGLVLQDDEDMQESLRRQLWAVYQHVQNGSIPLEEATLHYRDAFITQDMCDETLVVCLQQFDIPTDHILKNERSGRRGSAHSPSPSGVESTEKEVKDIDIPDAQEESTIEELIRYVQHYRSGSLYEYEVIPMIQDWLTGLPLDSPSISDILNDLDIDEKTAALRMFEDACDNVSEEDEAFHEEDDEEDDKDFNEEYDERFRERQAELLSPKGTPKVLVPESQGNDGKEHEAAVVPPTDGSNAPYGPMTEAIEYPDDLKENEAEKLEAMSIDRRLMSRIATPPDTPRPKPALLPAATEESVGQADERPDSEPPRDRETSRRRRLLSPDDGMTTGIWGLLMPTKEARRHAHQMNLPQATINEQVRSISPRRIKRRRASYAKTIVTFPKSKRKASMTLHRDSPLKSPKRGDHSDIFAREGEDQESFVLSHFNHDPVDVEDTCNTCLRVPCQCFSGSSPHSKSEPECPKCLQKPCVCGHLTDLDEAIPSTPRDGKPTSHIGLSLLNSSSDHGHFPTLLPNPSASEAASPENESNMANVSAFQAINKPLAKYVSPYSPISAPESNALHLEPISDAKNAVQPSRFQASTIPDSSAAAGYTSRAGPDSGSAARGELSTTGGRPSKAEVSSGSPARSPPSSSAELSEQVSEHLVDAKSDTDHDTWGATLTRQPHSALRDAGDSELEMQPPPTPRPKARQLPTSIPPPSPRLFFDGVSEGTLSPPRPGSEEEFAKVFEGSPMGKSLKTMTEDTPPPPPRPGSVGEFVNMLEGSPRPGSKEESAKMYEGSPMGIMLKKMAEGPSSLSPGLQPKESSKNMNVSAQSCLKSPVSDSHRRAQPGLPRKAGKEWMGLSSKKALEDAKEEALGQRKSLAFYLEERRAVRTRIRIEKHNANLNSSDHSFYQSSTGSSGSSGSTSTVALNKLFDKYRGTSDI